MRLVEPWIKVENFDGVKIMKRIERACRTCYRSEDKISEESYKNLLTNCLNRGHESVLEHEKITVRIYSDIGTYKDLTRHRFASFSVESTRYCSYNKDKYGNEIAKDTFRVPVWVYWLILAACPLAFIIIGTQLMALAWRACGKTIADQQWTKVVFWILTAAIILWIAAVTVDCIRYEYARWLYKEAAKNLSEDESLMFSFTSRIWGIGFHIYGFYKWLWVLGWGACGMALAILWPEKKQQTPS